jgi:hypothetical protein
VHYSGSSDSVFSTARPVWSVGIDERGRIVGWADTKSGKTHAVLWTWRFAR